MKVCNDCGAKINDDNFKFCPKCGGQNLSSTQNMNFNQNFGSNQNQHLDIGSLAGLIYNYVYGYIRSQECINLVDLGVQQPKGMFGSFFGPSKQDIEDRKFYYNYRFPVILASVIIQQIALSIPSLTEKGLEGIKSAFLLTYIGSNFKKEAWLSDDAREFGKVIRGDINKFSSINDESEFWFGDKFTQQMYQCMFETGITVDKTNQFFKGQKQIVSLVKADFPNFYNKNIAGKTITETVGGKTISYS